MLVSSFVAACGLALIHLLSSRMRFLDVIPRSRWLSMAGGVAVAYALLHLLPELQERGAALSSIAGSRPGERLIYVLTLAGLVTFYGLMKAAQRSRGHDQNGSRVFWLHIASYAFYNGLLGYLLVREDRSLWSLVLFFIGIGLHFVVNDHGLQQEHRAPYRRRGRWILSTAVLVGWVLGVATAIDEAVTASMIAFLAGGILLNTFKEELPEERESRFGAFLLGAVTYTLVLLAI